MEHIQQQILDAIQQTLATGGTAAGMRVYLEPLDPLEDDKLPAIVVEEARPGDRASEATVSAMQERTLDVAITCVVTHAQDYGRNTRALGLEVEKLLAAFPMPTALRGIVKAIQYVGSHPEFSGEGRMALAARIQIWRCTYFCQAHAPDVPL